ncbi:hypothetical protein ACS5PN_17270 [Roseateles sp. NT4]|uniref:RHS repeat domain-containing protein n=1 Tax=Roseateles sp. NT4 TaxID=3453715 RepID=UPI003EE9C38F
MIHASFVSLRIKAALPLALLLIGGSDHVVAGLRKTVVSYEPDASHQTTYSWYDTSTEANTACAIWAQSKGLGSSCGGMGGPGENTGVAAAGWAGRDPFVYLANYYCDDGYEWDEGFVNCRKLQNVFSFSSKLPSCSAKDPYGNPIEPLNGKKAEVLDLGIGVRYMRLSLAYDSLRMVLAKQLSQPVNAIGAIPSVGGEWTPSWAASIYRRPDQEAGKYVLQYFNNRGNITTFQGPSLGVGATLTSASDPEAKLTITDEYGGIMVRDPANGVLALFTRATPERFAMSELWQLDGSKITVTLSAPWSPMYVGNSMVNGLPISVADPFGQYAVFRYGLFPESGDPQIDAKVTKILSTSGSVDLGYSAEGRLDSFTWADGKVQTLVLESTTGGVGPLWTGVKDEDDKRFSTFSYDADGYATSTERAGGTNKFSSSFTSRPQLSAVRAYDSTKGIYTRSFNLTLPSVATVTGPNGQSVSVTSKSVQGQNVPASKSQPAGSGCAASTRSQDFDASGNLNWQEDFRGYRSCYANDLTRNLTKTRVEGLPTGTACAALLVDGAALPAGSRKITAAWHPVWRLETKVAEPRRLVTKVYNGQPDPFNSNTIASCAPATALLPDGSPIVVLCKQVEQATTDADGSKGFSATLDTAPSVPKREEKWTYDAYGRVLTYSDPRSNVTTYAYFSDTTADHTPGDLDSVTNAKQQVIHYTKYNTAGQWLEMTDANNVLTVRTFDARQRLKISTTNGALTSYDYWPTGLLKTVTQPDLSSVSYGYDDAHRLTTITDNRGNSITYTLDNSGIRTGEVIKDPANLLTRSLTRIPDALNRIQQVTGRE